METIGNPKGRRNDQSTGSRASDVPHPWEEADTLGAGVPGAREEEVWCLGCTGCLV